MNIVEPIIEYLPLDPHLEDGRSTWELFSSKHSETTTNYYWDEVKRLLQETSGVYIFYDSAGRAIYVGKAEKQDLWAEMTSAFTRTRNEHQTMFTVDHPRNNVSRVVRDRKIVQKSFTIMEVARYFSAYRVDAQYISSMEAFLIRAFANNLMNKKIESFRLPINT